MARCNRLVVKQSLWVCGLRMTRDLRHAKSDLEIIRARGAKVFLVTSESDQACLEELRKLLWKTDTHIILSWLMPRELNALRPLLRERKNFSIVADDWWIQPYWFMREADYIIFRKYQGIAVRLGQMAFVPGQKPPLLFNPFPQYTGYLGACMALRPAALLASPLVNLWNYWRRHDEPVIPEKYLFLPFGINCVAETPFKTEEIKYDFANTAGAAGAWGMRDPYVPFQYSFANLYHDRKYLIDAIAKFNGQPFKFYDCRREKDYWLPYDMYLQKSRQSRYLITTGGFQEAALPKYLEYGWLGTPMIGRSVPYEHPWLDDCLFTVDPTQLAPDRLKPLLQQAVERYPVIREKSLNWRERLLKQYDFNVLLDMLQEQADGKPVRPGYLKVDLKASDALTTANMQLAQTAEMKLGA
jgi:hypothetical protein